MFRLQRKSAIHQLLSLAFVWIALLIGSLPAAAHDLPMNSIMNAFLRIDTKEAHLVVRVPTDLLRGVPFPVRDGQYDTKSSATAAEIALLLLEDGFALFENDARLSPSASSGRLSPPSDRSFETFEAAAALADRPADPVARIPYDKGSFDVHFTYPIASPKSVFKIQTHVAADLGNGALLTLRYLPIDDESRAMVINSGSEPAVLNPAWYHAAGGFVGLGIEHILTGFDHLLFLFCLVIPFRRLRGLISVITAFTLAHSVTLFASAFHLAPQGAWFPPFVEMAIAASIVYTAAENTLGANLRRRWLVAGMFGLVHGFGFSNALGQSLQFAGSHLLLSLFAFNVGIEIGQLAVLAIMLPALALLRRFVPERVGIVALSGVVALIGGYWMIERWQVLRQAEWPRLDDAGVNAARWLFVLLMVVVTAVLLARRSARRSRQRVVEE